jgi:uncharacterized protein (DUF2267 family)
MQFDDMTDYVLEHTAINERAEAIHWLEETLTAFAKCLTPAEAQRLALEVPAPNSCMTSSGNTSTSAPASPWKERKWQSWPWRASFAPILASGS